MGIMAHIESVLGRPHIYNNPEYIQGFTIYTPVKPFRDEHGVVVAQVINVQREGEVITDNYYSRAWAYWNFIDNTLFDLKEADELLQLEAKIMPNTEIDFKISESETVLMWLDHGLIPIESEFWQRLVVSLAYNTITDADFLTDLAENTWYGPKAVQEMLDKAAGEVLKHPNFSLAGFEQLTP
jgi:hypothetical protein